MGLGLFWAAFLWPSLGQCQGASLAFQTEVIRVDEGDPSVSIEVVRSGDLSVPVRGRYQMSGLSAASGRDFVAGSGTVSFKSGEVSRPIQIPILDDLSAEGEESFLVSLQDASGSQLAEAIVVIRDNEQPVVLDHSFGSPFGPDDEVAALALTSDGRVLAGGRFFLGGSSGPMFVVRVLPNGDLDESFMVTPASVGISGEARELHVLADEKVLVFGEFRRADVVPSSVQVFRLNPDGTLDESFEPISQIDPNHFWVHSDQEWFVGMMPSETGLIRFSASGERESFFDGWTILRSSGLRIHEVAFSSKGDLLVGGHFRGVREGGDLIWNRPNLFRVRADGTVEDGFSVAIEYEGAHKHANVTAIAFDSSDRGIAAGQFDRWNDAMHHHLVRFGADGSVDPDFRPRMSNGSVSKITLQPDGRILVAIELGRFSGIERFGIARLNLDGTLDGRFNSGSGVSGQVADMLPLPGGDVLIGGTFNEVDGVRRRSLARLVGSRVSFRSIGFTESEFKANEGKPYGELTVERWGDLGASIEVGYSLGGGSSLVGVDYRSETKTIQFLPGERLATIRVALLDDGELDGAKTLEVALAVPQSEVNLGGRHAAQLRIEDNELPSVVDDDFVPELVGPSLESVVWLPDGKLLVAGRGVYDSERDRAHDSVVRLLQDGRRDESFQPDWFSGYATSEIGVLSDGRIMVVGDQFQSGGTVLRGWARLLPDGRFDPSFQSSLDENVRDFAVAGDDTLLVLDGNDLTRFSSEGKRLFRFSLADNGLEGQAGFVSVADNRVYLYGKSQRDQDEQRLKLLRLTHDLKVDESFTSVEFQLPRERPSISVLAESEERSVFIGGGFRYVNGQRKAPLVRLLSDGKLDEGFNVDAEVEKVHSLAVDSIGRLVGIGELRSYDYQTVLFRLTSEGDLDETFGASVVTPVEDFDDYFYGRVPAKVMKGRNEQLYLLGVQELDGTPRPPLIALNDDVAAPTLSLSPTPIRVVESEGDVLIPVIRRGSSSGEMRARIQIVGGEAEVGQDLRLKTEEVHFPPLSIRQAVALKIHADHQFEKDESASLALLLDGELTARRGGGKVEIIDDDRPGSVDLSFQHRYESVYQVKPDGHGALYVHGRIESETGRETVVERVSYDFVPDRTFPRLLDIGRLYHVDRGQRILLFNRKTDRLERYDANGEWDTTFVAPDFRRLGESAAPDELFETPSGQYWAIGYFDRVDGAPAPMVTLLNSDGSVAEGYEPGRLGETFGNPAVMQRDGKLLIVNSQRRHELLRLDLTGQRDETFSPALEDGRISALAIDSQDRILVSGVPDFGGIVRLHPNGKMDRVFASGLQAKLDDVTTILPTADGRYLVGGSSSQFNELLRPGLLRLHADGTVDTVFDPGLGLETPVQELPNIAPRFSIRRPPPPTVFQFLPFPNGQVLVRGRFYLFNGFEMAEPSRGSAALVRLNGDLQARILEAVLTADEQIELDIIGRPGRRHRVERTNDFLSWHRVDTVEPSSAVFQWSHAIEDSLEPQFYRVTVE